MKVDSVTGETVTGEAAVSKGREKPASRLPLVLMAVLLAGLVVAVIVLAVELARTSEELYRNSKALVVAVRDNPAEMVHFLRESDGSGAVLSGAFRAVRGRDEKEFERFAGDVSARLTGDDQVAFFISANPYGEKNAAILGYLAGCLANAGIEEPPYPAGKDGKPYDGASELPYEREFMYVSGK